MTTTITGAAITTATVAATTSVTTDLIQYDTAKDEAGGFTKQQVVQVVNVTTGAVATGTTQLPYDDTIPQNDEGDQYMSLAITPKSASNKLRIEVQVTLGNTTAWCQYSVALFQDSTADALAVVFDLGNASSTNWANQIYLNHYMAAGTTSETTFKVRIGENSAGTNTLNGVNGGRWGGGKASSSITITEYTP